MTAPAARVRTADGVELALFRAPVAGKPRRTAVLLVHGTFSNRNFFHGAGERGLAFALAQRGFDAWVDAGYRVDTLLPPGEAPLTQGSQPGA